MPAKPPSLQVQINAEVPFIRFDDLVYDPHSTKKKGYAKEQPAAEEDAKARAAAKAAQKQQAKADAKAKAQAEAADKERAAFAMEIQRKAQAKAIAAAQKNLKRQDALIKACEEGDTAQVKQLLGQGASPTAAGRKGNIQPLGAAVWGMNTEVVSTLLEEMKDESPMAWEECKAHNHQYYGEVFMFSDFSPNNFMEWDALLFKMSRSPYLRALHLAEAKKVGIIKANGSWESFDRWMKAEWETRYSCENGSLTGVEWGLMEVVICAKVCAVFVGLNGGVEERINRAVHAQKIAH